MKRIYERYEALSPIYQGGLTNHLPMVLTALKNLGLSDALITVRLDHYKEVKGILDLTETTTPISEFEQEYINRTSFYLGELHHKGEDIIIGEFINKYKYNISSALFHGLIRLAYAKQEKNDLMIAQALAYFELSSETIEQPNAHVIHTGDFGDGLQRMMPFMKLNYQFKSTRTMDKYKELLEIPEVQDNLVMLRDINKEFVLDYVLRNYLRTSDFFILHLITGFEALLELEEYIFDFDEVLNHFFLITQVFCLFDTSNIEDFTLESTYSSLDLSPFDDLMTHIPELIDAHDMKLFYSLFKLNKQFENKWILTIANNIFEE